MVVGGSLLYAYYWEAPSSSDRLLPTVPLAFATIATIIALNTAVFIAWRIPIPMNWRILNRYFITVTAMPHSFSMLGSAFSHQTPFHLGMNMLVLYSIGTSLCEQIGSGAFVGLYLSGAVVSSLGSLVFNVTTKRFATSSLGASGAIACIIGAYTYLNPDRELFIIFLPFLAMKAKYMVSCAAAFEVLGMARGWRSLDHAAHFSGMVWGVAGGWMLWKEWQRRIRAAREKRYFR